MITRAEAIAQVADHIIDHDAHGYDQPNRAGDGTKERITLTSGEVVTIHGGDYDCSEMVRQCCAAVGCLPDGYFASYMWTGNEHQMLTTHGFKQIPVKTARWMQRGDILLRDGHTEVYLGNGMQGGARGNEFGGIKNGKKGDQTGREIMRSAYDPSRWSRAYRWAGPEKNEQMPGDPVNYAGMNYRAHVQSVGWLAPVHDGQIAGTTGLSLRLEALKITPPAGVELEVTAHIQDIGDVVYKGIKKGESSGTGSSGNDPLIGTTGGSLRLEGISIRCTKNTTGLHLRYRLHVQDVGWQEWKKEGEFAGTRGRSLRAEAIQIVLE